ncbi:MAG: hypothetical protein ACW97Z_04270 [Candidatus Hodarchaeales archaeon]|jgi:hypothetical protein
MADDPQILMELAFNIFYLAFIWLFVTLMTKNFSRVSHNELPIAKRFRLALFLLAFGDTGHVGFRVMAYLNGGLEANATLVGLGALSTAITITFFYMIFLDIWRVNFNHEKSLFYYLVQGIGILRLLIMAFPQNQWGNIFPPPEWGLIRNIPLTIIGLVVAFLMLKDGFTVNDSRYKYFGYSIIVSYAFYIPVILLVTEIPIIGMLMIPKTVAYMVMAWLAYKYYFVE